MNSIREERFEWVLERCADDIYYAIVEEVDFSILICQLYFPGFVLSRNRNI